MREQRFLTCLEHARAEMPLKLGLGIPTALFLTAAYLAPQYIHFFPPRQIAPTLIDRAVPFDPRWTWVYFSIYPFLVVSFFSISHPATIRRCCLGVSVMYGLAFFLFLCWQIEGPRPAEVSDHWPYSIILAADKNLNTLPSLHIGLLTFVLCAQQRAYRNAPRQRIATLVFFGSWALLITYSTLATKQHHFVDIPSGVALGWVAYRIGYRFGGRQERRVEGAGSTTQPKQD